MCIDFCKRCGKQTIKNSGDLNLNGYCEDCARLSYCKKCDKLIDKDVSLFHNGKCFKCFTEDEYKLYTETQIFSNQGWICPKCGNVYSPYVESCWKCMNKEITC
jgi:hypothetical protein